MFTCQRTRKTFCSLPTNSTNINETTNKTKQTPSTSYQSCDDFSETITPITSRLMLQRVVFVS
jgi:hypothetical protein